MGVSEKRAYDDAAAQDMMYQEAYQAALTNVNDLKYNIEVVADAVNDKNKALEIKMADLRYFDEAQMFLNEVVTQCSALQQEMLSTRHAAMNAAQLDQLAQNVRLADRALAWSEQEAAKAGEGVTAGITGVISNVMIAEGMIVAEGSPLFTVKDTEYVKAVVEVTSYEMADVELGQRATVEIGGNVYEGKVSRIRMETITDSQNNVKLQVEIHIDEPDGTIYLGTDADAVIETGEKEHAILMPDSALYADDGENYCYLIENGIVAKRYIICGLDCDRNTEVLEGLSGGEQVIRKCGVFGGRAHMEVASILTYNDENSLCCAIGLAYYSARKDYKLVRELPAGKGFADVAFLPLPHTYKPALIVELKYDRSARCVIQQIKDRQYTQAFADYTGEILLVGISYDRDKSDKPHDCVIERVKKGD